MATTTLFTLADYAALPDDGKRHELVEGELVELTFPKWTHSRIQARIFSRFDRYLERQPIGVVGNDFGFVLGRDPDTLRGPDLYFLTNERAAAVDRDGWCEGAPDLAVEIVSPSNRGRELERKIGHYRVAGVRRVWVLDPAKREARIYGSAGEPKTLGEGDTLADDELLPGFALPVADIFAV